MGNVFLAACRGGSMLAALAFAALWGRSYTVTDQFLWPTPVNMPGLVDSRVLMTAPGGLVFYERSAFA